MNIITTKQTGGVHRLLALLLFGAVCFLGYLSYKYYHRTDNSLREENANLHDDLTKVTKRADEATAERKKIADEKASLQKELDASAKALKDAPASEELQKVKAELADAIKANAEIAANLTAAQIKNDTVDSRVSKAKEDAEKNNPALNSAKTELALAEKARQNSDAEAAKAVKEKEDAEKNLGNLKSQLVTAQSDLALEKGKNGGLEKQLAEAQKESLALQTALAQAKVITSAPTPAPQPAVAQGAAPYQAGPRDIQLPILRNNEPPLKDKRVGSPDATMTDFLEYLAGVADKQAAANPAGDQAEALKNNAKALRALKAGVIAVGRGQTPVKLTDDQKWRIGDIIKHKLERNTDGSVIDAKQLKLALEQTRNS